MPFAEFGDARIHYRCDGPENATAVLLSNSLGVDLTMWDAQAAAWSGKFRVLRYDTRGHGQSSVTPGPYSMQQLACDVVALMDAVGIKRAHFCGLSMGGQTGMWLAGNAPERLSKMVLCNTGAKIGTVESWAGRIETVKKEGMAGIAPQVIERWFTSRFRGKEPAKVSAVQKLLEATNPQGYIACSEAVRDFDYRERLEKIAVPTLVIAGSEDPSTPPADGRRIAERIAGARFVELNAAHLSNIEDEARFTKEVGDFLSAQASEARGR
jgi:3-oxoadipate enol-lactonase